MVSVCIACHNGEEFIVEQINSILSQLSLSDEIIISDDGSSDSTKEKILGLNDSRIRVYDLKEKSDYSSKRQSSFYYASQNFANALKYARGDYIFLADQDDRWRPDKLSKCITELLSYDIVCHNFDIMDKDGVIIDNSHFMKDMREEYNIYYLLKKLPFRGCCLAFNRNVLLKVSPLPDGVFLHDCYIGVHAVLSGFKYKFIDEVLIDYRRHGNNVSTLDSINPTWFKIWYRIKILWDIFMSKYKTPNSLIN